MKKGMFFTIAMLFAFVGFSSMAWAEVPLPKIFFDYTCSQYPGTTEPYTLHNAVSYDLSTNQVRIMDQTNALPDWKFQYLSATGELICFSEIDDHARTMIRDEASGYTTEFPDQSAQLTSSAYVAGPGGYTINTVSWLNSPDGFPISQEFSYYYATPENGHNIQSIWDAHTTGDTPLTNAYTIAPGRIMLGFSVGHGGSGPPWTEYDFVDGYTGLHFGNITDTSTKTITLMNDTTLGHDGLYVYYALEYGRIDRVWIENGEVKSTIITDTIPRNKDINLKLYSKNGTACALVTYKNDFGYGTPSWLAAVNLETLESVEIPVGPLLLTIAPNFTIHYE